MADTTTGPLDDVFGWCAILRTFDLQTLIALGVAQPQAEAVLTQSHQLVEGGEGRYHLDHTTRRILLDRLRRERPRAEIEMHARAFSYFIDQLERAVTPEMQVAYEDDSLYHLGVLHDLLIEYMEWTSIIPFTLKLRALLIQRQRIIHWCEFYEAYLEVRTEAVAQGRARLEQLLTRDDLEPLLRLKALHACHIAYISLSRYDRALELLAAARPLARRLGDHARHSYLLLSIGQIHNDLYNNRRALMLSRLSLRLARKSGALYREVHALYEVGNNAMQLGLWEEALAALDEAETTYSYLGMSRRIAMVLWAKGMIYQIDGDLERSGATLQRALAIAQSDNTHNALTAMDILMQLGLLYQMQADTHAALAHFSDALALAYSHDIRHWRPVLRARVAGILAQHGRPAEAEAEWRAAVEEVEGIRNDIGPEEIRVSLFGTAQFVYESFVLFLLEQGKLADAFAYIERARARAFLDLLQRQGASSGSDPQPSSDVQRHLGAIETATLQQLQRQLGSGEVVLEYFTTAVRPRGVHWLNTIPARNRALAEAVLPRPTTIVFVITSDHVEVHRLRDVRYEPAMSSERRDQAPDLDTNKLQPSAQSEDPVLDMLRMDSLISWLSQRLLAPIEHMLQNQRQVTIIPHGPLHYVPFTALLCRTGESLLHAGGPAIVFAPSASILSYTQHHRPRGTSGAGLVIGYNGPETNQLEYAEQEATSIASLLQCEEWIGPAAKSQRLMNQRRWLRWLHIAGHAIYDSKQARTAKLHLGQDDILDAAQIMAVDRWPCRADIVTLSSCMSGFSYVAAGDELFGLQRAFLYAVAPTVVCTMARARDRVALLVMEQFYTRLLQDQTIRPAEALRDALVAVRTMTRMEVNAALARHGYTQLPDNGSPTDQPFNRPEYWAPFIMIGRS